MIYVISLIGNNNFQIEKVEKLIYSSWKDYAIKWSYTKDESEIESIKEKMQSYYNQVN